MTTLTEVSLTTGVSMSAPAALAQPMVMDMRDKDRGVVVNITAHRSTSNGVACWSVAFDAAGPAELLAMLAPVVAQLEALA